jgi:uncharacterized membrane protein YidH (DUF202 family)
MDPHGRGQFDETGDATRRTRLANERTYLAWWRTGLTAFAVSLGAGRLVPALTDATHWPYVVVGVGFLSPFRDSTVVVSAGSPPGCSGYRFSL